MKLIKSLTIVSIFSLFLLFSCSDNSTDTDSNKIPDDATEFPNAQAAAQFAASTLNGIGNFVVGSIDVFNHNSTKKLGTVTGDSLYYKDGWWYYISSIYYNEGGNGFGISMELNNKYQLKKNGKVQQAWETADEVHAIIDAEGTFDMEATSMELKYYFDVNYHNVNSDILPIIIDGNGYYDIKYTTEETSKQRYYIIYKFDNLKIPEDDYPTGILKIGTKKYDITMTFDGTNIVNIAVMQDGKTVYTMEYNMDYDGDNA